MNAIHVKIRMKTAVAKKRLRVIALPITRVNQLMLALALNQSYRNQSL